MKKAGLLFSLFLLFVIPMAGQADHAVTPEQCRADVDGWDIPTWDIFTPHTQEFQSLEAATAHSTLNTRLLDARIAELAQCEKTDKRHEFDVRYERGIQAYQGAEMTRVVDFMKRHNLVAQFYQEDSAGQR